MTSYFVCGLHVDTDLALPAFDTFPPIGDVEPDIQIRRTNAILPLDDVTHTGPNWQLSPTRYRLTVPGIVDMAVREGRAIDYVLLGANDADAAAFIASTGLGALLHQRGDVVLHASAVQVGGGAALFCGPSGAGKSTIAAALVERGFPLVNDDFCAVRTGSGQVSIFPDGRQHKLWEETVEQLAVGERVGMAVRPALRKFYVAPRLSIPPRVPLRIAAVYALGDDRRPEAFGLHSLNVVDAARAIRRNAYRPMLTRLMGQQRLYFDMTTRLLAQATVQELVRPLDFARLPETLDLLEADWKRVGLAGHG